MKDSAPPPGRSVMARLEDASQEARGIARDGTGAFNGLAEALGDIRGDHLAIGGALDGFADLVAEDPGTDAALHAVDARLAALQEALRTLMEATGSLEARRAAASAQAYLEAIAQAGRTLTAIATLTRTTAASMGVTTLTRYLQDLAATAAQITAGAGHVGDALHALSRRSGDTLEACARSEAAVDALAPRIAGQLQRFVALSAEERKTAQAIAHRARRLSEDGRRQIKALVTIMQFSDRMAQRLDHVAAMLDRGDTHVARLAGAHAASCARDIAQTCHEARKTLARLEEMGARAAGLLSEGELAETATAALTIRQQTGAMVADEVAQLRRVIAQLAETARAAEETGRSAELHFDGLEDGTKRLAVASINSMLLSSRSGEGRGALVTLSTEVRQTASDCLAAVGGGRARLNAVLRASADRHEALAAAIAGVEAAVTEQARGTDAAASRIDRLNGLRADVRGRAAALAGRLGTVETRIQTLAATGTRLASLADRLADVPVEGGPDPAVLAEVWATYTMDEERCVHAELYAPLPGASAETDAAASDDLDDVFF